MRCDATFFPGHHLFIGLTTIIIGFCFLWQPIFTETINATLLETYSLLNHYVLRKWNGCRLQRVTTLLFFHSIILSSINLLCYIFLLLAHHRHPKQTSQLSHGLYAFHSVPILILFYTKRIIFSTTSRSRQIVLEERRDETDRATSSSTAEIPLPTNQHPNWLQRVRIKRKIPTHCY